MNDKHSGGASRRSTVALGPVDGVPGDQVQEERHEAAVRAGGAAAPEHDREDVGDLEQQTRERPVRVLRKRLAQPTAAEVQEWSYEPYRSWCRACVAGRGRADAHVGRPGVEKGVPIIGVHYGYLWSRAPEASDAPHDEVAGEDPQIESEPRRQCFVEGAVWIGGYLVIFVRQKGTISGIVPCWQRSCKLEATPGWSCAAMVSLRCWRT